MELGIIGSGNIGTAIARLATAAGIDVTIANSRGPESLGDLVAELGPRARAGTVEQAAGTGGIVVLTVPLSAATALDPALLAGEVVLDTGNYYPHRDGRIAELDSGETTTTELVQRHLADSRVVKAFNNILAHHIPRLARPAGAADRSALPLAGDHPEATAAVAALVDQLGFDTVDTGSLADSWRFEPEAGAYTRTYLADPTTPWEEVMTASEAPLSADALRAALAASQRVDVAARQF